MFDCLVLWDHHASLKIKLNEAELEIKLNEEERRELIAKCLQFYANRIPSISSAVVQSNSALPDYTDYTEVPF